MKAPTSCPMCASTYDWVEVNNKREGFSVGKAAVGGVLLGPLGLAAGALGKKKVYYKCRKCGFTQDYDAK